MIERVDQQLIDWIGETLDQAAVSLGPPGEVSESGVNLYLLEIVREPPLRVGKGKPPLQVMLRYLVTVHGDDVAATHRQLWTLIVDATIRSEHNHWNVEIEPLAADVWATLGTTPRPSFFLHVPLRHEWERPELPLVTQPPQLDTASMQSLAGLVLGPNEIPIAGARVELPSLGLSTTTESKGRFYFASLPAGQHHPKDLIVKAKGRTQRVELDADSTTQPLIIRLQLTEV